MRTTKTTDIPRDITIPFGSGEDVMTLCPKYEGEAYSLEELFSIKSQSHKPSKGDG